MKTPPRFELLLQESPLQEENLFLPLGVVAAASKEKGRADFRLGGRGRRGNEKKNREGLRERRQHEFERR